MEQSSTNQQIVDKESMFSAIDIGTTKIVALVGRKNEKGEIEVLGKSNVKSSGISRGEVLNITAATQSIIQAVNIASEEAGYFPKNVIVGVAGKHVHSIEQRVPLTRKAELVEKGICITQDELEELRKGAQNVRIECNEEIVHVIPQNYIVNGETIENPIGVNCRYIEGNFHVVVGDKQALTNIQQAVSNAGLIASHDMFYLEPLASSDAVLTEEEKKLGVALVDIGGGTTDIAIFHDNILQATEVVPFAGNIITTDIKTECDILENDAEELKVQFGCAIENMAEKNATVNLGQGKEISVERLASIIQSRMTEIINAVEFVIGTSVCGLQLSAGVVITGGGSKLKSVNQLFSYMLTKSTRIGMPLKRIKYKDEEFSDPIYSTSVGLLLKSAEIAEAKQKEKQLIQQEELKNKLEAEAKQQVVESKEKHETKQKTSSLFSSIKTKLWTAFTVEEADTKI